MYNGQGVSAMSGGVIGMNGKLGDGHDLIAWVTGMGGGQGVIGMSWA